MKDKKDVLAVEDNYYMKKKDSKKEEHRSNKKGMKAAIITLSITTGLLGLSTIGFGIGYGVMQSRADNYGTNLENVYQKNFYDLVDSVNNAEIKLSKVINSSQSAYQRRLLTEISQNTTAAEVSIAALPLSQGDINDNIRMINQISGYTSTLADKLAGGESLTASEMATLQEIYQNVLTMKTELNKFARKIQAGYNILDNSMNLDTGSDFSIQMAQLHDVNIDYPTMIYDGPFSDSVVNSSVKGLSGNKVSREDASKNISETFKNIISVSHEGDTNGRFETYNFRVKNSDEQTLYIQVSQIGGHILTVSGASANNSAQNIEMEDAEKIALEFAKNNGVENPNIVWKDNIKNDAYFNIAPLQNGVVLYPDLVKVKVDLNSGTVIGYDATTYFTNHTKRSLPGASVGFADVRGEVPKQFTIVGERKVLAPLDYNREVLCYEFECINSEDTFYFYFNASTGEEENILKVINTDDGSKLL